MSTIDEAPTTHEPARGGRGRPAVIALAALVVVLAVAAGALYARPKGSSAPTASQENPSAILDAALAQGQPTYILIHSLT